MGWNGQGAVHRRCRPLRNAYRNLRRRIHLLKLQEQSAQIPVAEARDANARRGRYLAASHGKDAGTIPAARPDASGKRRSLSRDARSLFGEEISIMSMADRDGLIWYDGELVPWREANTHVLTHTLHYGMGVFEGRSRLRHGSGRCDFPAASPYRPAVPFRPHRWDADALQQGEINEASRQAVSANNLASAYLRPMCFYGSEGWELRADNLKVHVIVAAWEWGAYLGAENLERGIRIRTSSFSRHHVNVTMCKAKANGNYMNSMLALADALRDGYDEAMLLDTEGYVLRAAAKISSSSATG
jgi:hypothetical protein